MTNKERVICALKFQKPDYTPHNIEFTHQMLDKMVEFSGDKDYILHINNHISHKELTKPEDEIKPEFFKDEFGVVWNRSGVDKDIGVIDEAILADYDDLKKYEFPEPDEGYINSCLDWLAVQDENNFHVAELGFSMFERAWTLRGMEDLMCDMITEPDFVHELMGKIFKRNMRILDIALKYNFDCFHFGDDWGQQKGLIMGPDCWREFIKPYLSQMYAKIRDAGRYVSQHSCGDLRDILGDLHEMGLNIYQTYQPEIYGSFANENLHGKITIWGGISTQRDLPVKTPEEIKVITKDFISQFPSGGLIAAPTHYVPGDVPPENVAAMVDVFMNQ